jgi:hypothetical protein
LFNVNIAPFLFPASISSLTESTHKSGFLGILVLTLSKIGLALLNVLNNLFILPGKQA